MTFFAEPVTLIMCASAFTCRYAHATMATQRMLASARTNPARSETTTLAGSGMTRPPDVGAERSVVVSLMLMRASLPGGVTREVITAGRERAEKSTNAQLLLDPRGGAGGVG